MLALCRCAGTVKLHALPGGFLSSGFDSLKARQPPSLFGSPAFKSRVLQTLPARAPPCALADGGNQPLELKLIQETIHQSSELYSCAHGLTFHAWGSDACECVPEEIARQLLETLLLNEDFWLVKTKNDGNWLYHRNLVQSSVTVTPDIEIIIPPEQDHRCSDVNDDFYESIPFKDCFIHFSVFECLERAIRHLAYVENNLTCGHGKTMLMKYSMIGAKRLVRFAFDHGGAGPYTDWCVHISLPQFAK